MHFKEFERRAAEELVRKGHRILLKNHRIGRSELDLVTKSGQTLYIVEVKYRKNALDDPSDYLNRSQQERLVAAGSTLVGPLKCREIILLLAVYDATCSKARWFEVHL